MRSTSRFTLAVFATALVSACGTAHVRTDGLQFDVSEYRVGRVGQVKVYSLETNAPSNQPLQEKLAAWTEETTHSLESTISQLSLVPDDANRPDEEAVLVFGIDSNVRYGNRALRWAVGFGAGKGGVTSILTVTDSRSGKNVYRATAESDLSVGGGGGDMGSVFRKNIDKLLTQFRKETGIQ